MENQVEIKEEKPEALPESQTEGGFAFPVGIPATTDNSCWLNEGMKLRDYFAAKAMQAVITNLVVAKTADGEYLRNVDDVAALAYKQADAMLKAKATASERAR